jgi:high affinity Mn2+ porin
MLRARPRLLLELALLLAATPAAAEPVDPPAPAVTKPGRWGFGRWWSLGAQLTAVGQVNTPLRSPYANPALSFGPRTSPGWSLTTSVIGAVRLWHGAFVMVMPEFADGSGMPNVGGISGYPDGDIVRVVKAGIAPYLARTFFHQDIPLSKQRAPADDTELHFEDKFIGGGPAAFPGPEGEAPFRLEITVGKISTTDVFDVSHVGSDPRHHFLNWSLFAQNAWDYAADTQAYTWGAVVDLEHPWFAVRAGVALMPTTQNGPTLEWDVRHSGSVMLEGEVRWYLRHGHGSAKLLLWANWARMGRFDDALAAAAPGKPPSVVDVEKPGTRKMGLGLLVDQEITRDVSAFLRAGINDGQSEPYCFTGTDRSLSAGAEMAGVRWRRPDDRLALGLALGGLSDLHARYLAAGGQTFQLGDGALRRAWEVVIESYYTFGVLRYLELTLDVQAIFNPGMNADRGPTLVFGTRLHAHY